MMKASIIKRMLTGALIASLVMAPAMSVVSKASTVWLSGPHFPSCNLGKQTWRDLIADKTTTKTLTLF